MGWVTRLVTCTVCGGMGSIDSSCGACGGQGSFTESALVTRRCPTCGGGGTVWGADGAQRCTACGGAGGWQEQASHSRMCAQCSGSGRTTRSCGTCSGGGVVPKQEWDPTPMSVTVSTGPSVSAATSADMRYDPVTAARVEALQWQRERGWYDSQQWMDEFLEAQRRRVEQQEEAQRYEEWEAQKRHEEALHRQHRDHI